MLIEQLKVRGTPLEKKPVFGTRKQVGPEGIYSQKNRPRLGQLDREKLQEENLALKQMLHSVQQSNAKLKARLSHLEQQLRLMGDRRHNDALDKGSWKGKLHTLQTQLHEKNRELEKAKLLQLPKLQRELRYSTEESARLRQRVSELETGELDNALLVGQLRKELEGLRSECQQDTAKLQEGPGGLTINLVAGQGQFLTVEDSRTLKRELATKDSTVLDTFFRKFLLQMKDRDCTLQEVRGNFRETYYLVGQFTAAVAAAGMKAADNEVQTVFQILSQDGQLYFPTFYANLERYAEDCNSDRSSDISSPCTVLSPLGTERAFPSYNIQEAIDLLAVVLKPLPKTVFLSKLDELPGKVQYEDLNKLLLEKPHRLEEGVERNQLIQYFLRNAESNDRADVAERIITDVYWYEAGTLGTERAALETLIQGHHANLLAHCKDQDRRLSGTLTWEQLSPVVTSVQSLTPEELFELKVLAFSYHSSLHWIPYPQLFADLAPGLNRKATCR